jgi:alanine racemase
MDFMRPAYAEIDLGAINFNLRQVRKQIGASPEIMAVLKANAYGHGMIPVARSILNEKTASSLGVAIVEEGISLRRNNIHAPVLVLTAPDEHQLQLFAENDLEVTLCSLSVAQKLNRISARLAKKAVVHVKLDTGMGRIGIPPNDAVEFIGRLLKMKNIYVKGLYTHFATSDEKEPTFARRQLSEFNSVVRALNAGGVHIPVKHCANSGAILQLPGSCFDMVRPGIMMYGYYPSCEIRKTLPLKPAMSIRATIGFLKTAEKGTSISYGRRYHTKSKTNIASVTVGYADGISRRLTNRTSAIVNGRRCPVVGTICMDQLMIDVGRRATCKVGDVVTLMGREGDQEISVWDISNALGTIPYEVCCGISERIPRAYIHG